MRCSYPLLPPNSNQRIGASHNCCTPRRPLLYTSATAKTLLHLGVSLCCNAAGVTYISTTRHILTHGHTARKLIQIGAAEVIVHITTANLIVHCKFNLHG